MSIPATRVQGRQRGQASVELIGAAVTVLIAGLVAFQLLAAGYAAAMAGHAAEAAALALVRDKSPRAAVKDALPGWPDGALRVRRGRDRVAVTLVAPSPFRALRDRLSFTAEAAVPEGEG